MIGIKGVGMTALACCLKNRGIAVAGTDVAEEFITGATLRENSIPVKIGFAAENITDPDLVIAAGSCHQGRQNPEAQTALKKGIPYLTHGEALGRLMNEKTGISVCGVGGKSTTSAMLATILEETAATKPSYAIGVAKIFPLGNPGRWQKGQYFVAEADEYVTNKGFDSRPRFNWQKPQFIICTNIEHDHPDVYPDLTATKKAFLKFFRQLKPGGKLIINGDHPHNRAVLEKFNGPAVTYGKTENNDWQITTVKQGVKQNSFSLKGKKEQINIQLSVPGEHNRFDAAAAAIAARQTNTKPAVIKQGLKKFRGTKRRFELIKQVKGVYYYDDYAHHPSEIKTTIRAAKRWLAPKRIITVFQSHTYSRTRQFLDDFAQSFPASDQVLITPIYGAREENKEQISAVKLTEAIRKHHPQPDRVNHVNNKEAAAEKIKKIVQKNDLVLTLGAGDIWKLHQLI